MTYKQGQRIKIRKDLSSEKLYPYKERPASGMNVTPSMVERYAGKIMTISSVTAKDVIYLKEDRRYWSWVPSMFAPITKVRRVR